MIEGYVVNNSSRSRYIFKQHVQSGAKISLEDMYNKYKNKFQGEFNVDFLEWLEKNKIPVGFDVVVEGIDEIEVKESPVEKTVLNLELDTHPDERFNPSKITPKEISELKIKDNPKDIIGRIKSIHKLRRAQTLCKDKPGKGTLTKLIRSRIAEIK